MKSTAAMMALFLATAGPAAPQARDEARPRDLQYLQGELESLDDELRTLEPGDARTEEFRQRAEEIREDVVYLKVKMRRHRRAGEPGTGVTAEEVGDVRRAVNELHDDLERAFGRERGRGDGERGGALRVPEGTSIEIRLDERLSSRTAAVEDRFEASVFRPVRVDGRLAIPAGARVRGVVTRAEPAQRPSKGGKLEMSFDALYAGAERLDLRATVSGIEGAEGGHGDAATKAGIGAVVGGVLGGILGGGKGAAIGIAIGGGGAVVATKGDDVELPTGTIVTLRLDRPLLVPRPEGRSGG